MSTNTQGAKGQRPVRTLIILMLVLIIGAATAVLTKATTINLGLDLRGGTSVTLQPRISDGDTGKVTTEAIDQAVAIIRSRVNSLGVAESEVTAQGSGTNRQIVISVPGSTGRRIVELVGNTAELRFAKFWLNQLLAPQQVREMPLQLPASALKLMPLTQQLIAPLMPQDRI